MSFRVPNIQITMDHGDRFRALTGVVGPLPNGGDPKYLLTGMILQELNPINPNQRSSGFSYNLPTHTQWLRYCVGRGQGTVIVRLKNLKRCLFSLFVFPVYTPCLLKTHVKDKRIQALIHFKS